MNKNAIKKFAIEARKKLIASVSDRAGMLGITAEGCSEPISKGIDFEVYKTVAGTEVTLGRTQCEQRRKLKEQIEARGFEAVVEEVAYTWFNRICAIRFMEVNDYLPTRVRVLSSEKEGKNEPDIVTQAPDVDLDFTDKEREYILDCKMNNKLDELFKMLFIKQCNKLSEILPELFEATEDYTEMLLNISYTNKDDIIHMLVNQEAGIPETDFNVSSIGEDGQPTGQVEIIGWLYQYYNTELKDDTFAQLKKNVKISKERIPAATQLFTPDWIVRYMVENSVGRLWIEHLRAVDPAVNEKEVAERFGWKYYLPEAEQEADVNIKLAEIRTSYKDLKPEDITCIDPCMGSGHILVAMFDVLMDIYKSAGYSERDAAFEIVEHNIHGLDIDKRAYQLAYFAVMMKGRGYNRRFFKGIIERKIKTQIYCFTESNDINKKHIDLLGDGYVFNEKNRLRNQLEEILDSFVDAREYGSIICVDKYDWDNLYKYINSYETDYQVSFDNFGIENTLEQLENILNVAKLLSKKYITVITNPPYMGGSGMNDKLSQYVKKNYPLNKSDLFAAFIEKGNNMIVDNGYNCMVTMQSWMFLSSFEKMRLDILKKYTIINLMHMDNMVMGIAFGTAVTIFRKGKIKGFKGTYNHITSSDIVNELPREFPIKENRFCQVDTDAFHNIPGTPIAYWVSRQMLDDFIRGMKLSEIAYPRQGMATTNNNMFLRLWYELDVEKIGFGLECEEETIGKYKWFPYNKGGDYRKWYGNNDYVVNFQNKGAEVCAYIDSHSAVNHTGRVINRDRYFKESVTWSKVSSGSIAFRYKPKGHIFDVAGTSIFGEEKILKYMIGFLNSNVTLEILSLLSPTLNYEVGHIGSIPVIKNESQEIIDIVNENIDISKIEWDSYETSWDFERMPLIREGKLLSEIYKEWEMEANNRFEVLKRNETRLNEIFIEMYNLQGYVSSDVPDKNVTVRKANLREDIEAFISYFVGCLFGRYSLDEVGVKCTSKIMNIGDYTTFKPCTDNILLITDEEYFNDDIVARFVEFVSAVYGEQYLEENLEFIARALGGKGTPKEIIRFYFVNEFYENHCSTYSITGSGKRPIYWMFDSGKENGFKALIYVHRYDASTIGRIRIDYLHKVQQAIGNARQSAEYVLTNTMSAQEKAKATKMIEKYTKQLAEIRIYDEAMSHLANQRIELDLDDGVKVNYEKFQGIEVAQEGKKAVKVNLLAKI